MVTSASNYGSSSRGAFGFGGVVDWVIQRKTALILTLYFLYLSYFFISSNSITYQDWVNLFSPFIFKVITIGVFFCLLQHVWIGIWTIATDYISNILLRAIFLNIVKLSLLVYLFWAIYIMSLV